MWSDIDVTTENGSERGDVGTSGPVPLLALKMEEEGHKARNLAASRRRKRLSVFSKKMRTSVPQQQQTKFC